MRPLSVFSAILIIVSILTVTQHASAEVTITDLGTLQGGTFSFARRINDSGQITGNSATASGDIHAFFWDNGVMTDIGMLPGGTSSSALALNNRGLVVGISTTTPGVTNDCFARGGPTCHAFLWESGVMTDLGTLGGSYSVAGAINNLGQVVGNSSTASGERHAFLWESGVMTDLGVLPGCSSYCDSMALAINNVGQVVGYATLFWTLVGPVDHAFLWSAETGMLDLGTSPWDISGAGGINDQGQVIGATTVASGDYHGFIWQNGVMTDLGTLGRSSGTADINNLGQIVGAGWLASPPPGEQHPFFWQNGVMTDLGTFGGRIAGAYDINDLGQVVGSSGTTTEYPTEYPHAFLWQNGVMTDLGTLPGGTSSSAMSINEAGQVVGFSATAGSDPTVCCIPTPSICHAVLWTVVNRPPVASFTFSPAAPIIGEAVLFDASGSNDSDGTIASYSWNFGDSAPIGSGVTATHSYSASGTYTVALAVADNGGLTASTSMTVTVLTPQQAVDQTVTDVQNLIDTGSLSGGQGQSLIAKLDSARRLMDRGNACQAIHMLELFIGQVQRDIDSGRLSSTEGQALIYAANRLIEDLRPSCSP